jgi:hypothetical protein
MHLTWGNLSFRPAGKPLLLAAGAGLAVATLLLVAIFERRCAAQGGGIWTRLAVRAGAVLAALLAAAVVLASGTGALTAPVLMEAALLAVAAGCLGTPGAAAIFVALAWTVRIGILPFADGPFDGLGMIVTSPWTTRVMTIWWPLLPAIAMAARMHRRVPTR